MGKKTKISVRTNFEEEGQSNCLIKNLYKRGVVASRENLLEKAEILYLLFLRRGLTAGRFC